MRTFVLRVPPQWPRLNPNLRASILNDWRRKARRRLRCRVRMVVRIDPSLARPQKAS